MYIFDRVIGKVVATGNAQAPLRYEFDFYQGSERKPFSEAKKVADEVFLTDRVAALHALYAEGNEGIVELTSDSSKIRGYQGGLVHLLFNKGRMHLVSPLRGVDARSSPLMLDIQAGRLNLDNEDEKNDSWEDTLFRKGFEVGYVPKTFRIIPGTAHHNYDYEQVTRRNRFIFDQIATAYPIALPDIGTPFVRSYATVDLWVDDGLPHPQQDSAKISVFKPGLPQAEIFGAGWAVLPYVSSIELFKYVRVTVEGDIRFTDLNIDKGKPVHRDIYVIDCETGQTHIWKAGRVLRTDDITVLLDENRQTLEELQRQGKLKDGAVLPVSPKLSAAIRQLPSVISDPVQLQQYQGLQKLLQ